MDSSYLVWYNELRNWIICVDALPPVNSFWVMLGLFPAFLVLNQYYVIISKGISVAQGHNVSLESELVFDLESNTATKPFS